MTDFPGVGYYRHTISSFSWECIGPAFVANAFDPGEASGAWPTANITMYLPLLLEFPKYVTKVFWANGATVSGNCALALYRVETIGNSHGGQLYTTGSTAQAGTSSLQITTLATPILLNPALYWFGFGCDNTTATFMRSAVGNIPMRIGGAQVESAYPPPHPTNAGAATQSYWPLVGLSDDANL